MFFGSRLNRLATSIRRGISKYSVGSDNPGLVFDFIDNFYQKDKNQTVNFDGAITHARAGNATMTDGYGPELVTNGGFDTDSGWTLGTGWSIQNNRAYHASGSNSNITQNIAVEADKAYILEFNILEGSADSLWFAVDGVFTAVDNPQVRGGRSFVFTHDTTETIAVGVRAGSSNVAAIDNVSVREMPVIKWGPHNLLTYSEDLSQQWTVMVGAVKSSTTETDPAGGNTAALITNLQNVDNARINRNLAITEDSTFGVFLKGTAGETINIEHGTEQQTVTLTSDWKLYTLNVTAPQTTLRIINRSGCTADEVYVAFPHVYRSDLGGMVDNPDRGDSYVPTTSSAKYLPRVGHHVYNGSAWVNEGVLAESEARTNVDTDSNTFTAASNATVTADQAVSPSGETDAWLYDENVASNNNICVFGSHTTVAGTTYASSIYVKYKAGSGIVGLIHRSNDFANQFFAWFDIQNGEALTLESGVGTMTSLTSTIEDVGNGWYRISTVGTDSAQATYNPSLTLVTADNSKTRETDAQCYVWQSQFEAGSTPSSLIPTSGATVTRAAETFTIPSANLPWPTPQYIGSELVTNGTFDTDLSGWTAGSSWSWVSGKAYDGDTQAGTHAELAQLISVTSGKVYAISFDISGLSGGNPTVSWAGSTLVQITADGNYEEYVVATASNHTLQFSGQNAIYYVDNVSVREINPLSVSIGMEGRVTFANTWTSGTKQEIGFFRWRIDNDNKLLLKADSTDAAGERLTATHEVNTVVDFGTLNDFVYEGVLQSVNVALRVGSTFFQVAADGQAGAENATLTSLVDLSATDLDLIDDYMGTIGTFRVWDKDLGDTGIVEATNPSLEPSLSLTFEGVGTNSFTVSDWSE